MGGNYERALANKITLLPCLKNVGQQHCAIESANKYITKFFLLISWIRVLEPGSVRVSWSRIWILP